MGIFNKARKKVEGTFDEDTLKQDVSSGALEEWKRFQAMKRGGSK